MYLNKHVLVLKPQVVKFDVAIRFNVRGRQGRNCLRQNGRKIMFKPLIPLLYIILGDVV